MRLILFLAFVNLGHCQWTSEDLFLYDLVEEAGVNFYEWFDIPKDATPNQVKKAYRKLTLEWHPDRNSAPDATEKFRQVAGIYEVLKSKELREKYDNILEFGLPSWRQPLYYYRRMRKLTWYEGLLVLLFIATIAHYCMMWAAYFEKTLVYKSNLKKSRKQKKEDPLEAEKLMNEALEEFKPKYIELLPVLIFKGVILLCKDVVFVTKMALERRNRPVEEATENKEAVKVPRVTTAPQPVFKFEVAKGMKAVSTNDPEMEKKYAAESAVVAQKQSGSTWLPDELAQLVRLSTDKFPAGTPNRWEQMGRVLNRSAEDVIAMAGKMKQVKQEDYTKLLMTSIQQSVPAEDDEVAVGNEWTQAEQKAFEDGLQKYPKGTEERWDRISGAIGSKTKKQVMNRFKQLSEMIKKKRNEATS